jgi:HAD superfamily phosphoserine phosphatase-like hydrolase
MIGLGDIPAYPARTIVFDVDGTLVRWQSMHSFFLAMVADGLFPRIASTLLEDDLREWRERKAPFHLFISRMVKVFQERLPGIRVEDAKAVAVRMVRREGGRLHFLTRELLFAAQELGLTTALISGTPEVVAQALAESLKATTWLGTEYPHENGIYTDGEPRQWVLDKGRAIKYVAMVHALNLGNSVGVGDSEGDIGMLELVRWPICFNPNLALYREAVKRRWPIVVERKNVIYMMKADAKSSLKQTNVAGMLPSDLAKTLTRRLSKLKL